ncbi:hypothetical protein [Orgyia pseudotsugata single capsid nuclopolyhedrovirus]|nr:hypothetical protein [Orgyia pseudotsugata single capsid nuclopolyhedrovirus]
MFTFYYKNKPIIVYAFRVVHKYKFYFDFTELRKHGLRYYKSTRARKLVKKKTCRRSLHHYGRNDAFVFEQLRGHVGSFKLHFGRRIRRDGELQSKIIPIINVYKINMCVFYFYLCTLKISKLFK